MSDGGCFTYQHRALRYEIASIEEGWTMTVVEPDAKGNYRCIYTESNHPYVRTLLAQYLNGTDFSGLYWKTSSPVKFAVSFYPSFRSRLRLYFDLTSVLQEGTSEPIPWGIYLAPFATLTFLPPSGLASSTSISPRSFKKKRQERTILSTALHWLHCSFSPIP